MSTVLHPLRSAMLIAAGVIAVSTLFAASEAQARPLIVDHRPVQLSDWGAACRPGVYQCRPAKRPLIVDHREVGRPRVIDHRRR